MRYPTQSQVYSVIAPDFSRNRDSGPRVEVSVNAGPRLCFGVESVLCLLASSTRLVLASGALFVVLHMTISGSATAHSANTQIERSAGLLDVVLEQSLATDASDLQGRINVQHYISLFDHLMMQLQDDTEHIVESSFRSVLEEYVEVVDDDAWLDFYFRIAHDLTSRGYAAIAYGLLVALEQVPLSDLETIRFYNLLGSVYSELGQFAEAVRWFQQGLDLAYQAKNNRHIFNINNSISSALNQAGDYEGALRYTEYGLRMLDEGYDIDLAERVRFLSNAAVVFRRAGLYDQAEALHLQTLQTSKENDLALFVAQNYANLGNLYRSRQDYDQALEAFYTSLEKSKQLQSLYGEIVNYGNIGAVYRLKGSYDQALQALLQAETLLESTSMSALKHSVYSEFMQLGEDIQDELLLARYEALYAQVDEEIRSLEQQHELLVQKNLLDVQVLERDRALSVARLEMAELKNQRLLLSLLFVLVGVSGVVVFVIFRHNYLFELYIRNVQLARHAGVPYVPEEVKRYIPNEGVPEPGEFKTEPAAARIDADLDNEAEPDEVVLLDEVQSEHMEQLFSQVVDLLKHEQIFTDSELTLETLAWKIGTNRKYVSMSINQNAGLNFNEFVNSFRVEHATSMLLDAETKQVQLKQLQLKCGFRSHSTFYRAFKQFTGLTPAQFQRLSRRKHVV